MIVHQQVVTFAVVFKVTCKCMPATMDIVDVLQVLLLHHIASTLFCLPARHRCAWLAAAVRTASRLQLQWPCCVVADASCSCCTAHQRRHAFELPCEYGWPSHDCCCHCWQPLLGDDARVCIHLCEGMHMNLAATCHALAVAAQSLWPLAQMCSVSLWPAR